MKTNWKLLASRVAALGFASLLLVAGQAIAEEIRVMSSGGFTAPYNEMVPEYERKTQHKVVTSFGASMGGAPDSIPMRLERGEPALEHPQVHTQREHDRERQDQERPALVVDGQVEPGGEARGEQRDRDEHDVRGHDLTDQGVVASRH